MFESESRPCNILIVDDIATNIQVLGNILRNEGYVLSFATSGLQALELVENDLFDLILLDVMMPGMDGFEVCKALKALPNVLGVPIIFLTAKTEAEGVIEGFKLGAVDYVMKPFNAEELIARVRTHVELKAARDMVEKRNVELSRKNQELERLNRKLALALSEVRTLRGILPICSNCKKIRLKDADPLKQESWILLEKYLTEHTEAQLTHGMCPQCIKKLYPEFSGVD